MKRHARNTALAMLMIGLAVPNCAQGGLVGGGPTVVTWTDGAADNDWETPGNWNVHVPQDGDAVIIDSGHHNVWLTKNSEKIRSLYVGSGIALYNFNHLLQVKKSSNDATTTITGDSSGLVVSDIGGSQQDFNTDYLVVSNGAYLKMDGGKAHVDFDADFIGDVELFGHGVLEVNGHGVGSDLVFSSNSELRPQGGNLRINMTGGGEISFGGAFIDVTEENSDLNVDGALSSAISDTLRIGADNRVNFDHDWEVSGLLKFVSGGGEMRGAPGEVSGELRVNGSLDARVANDLHFNSTSQANVNSYATLELGRVSAEAGHVTTLNTGSTLRVNIPKSGAQLVSWDGRINATSADFEVNDTGVGGQTGVFRLDGRMDVGSLYNSWIGYIGQTDLQGSAAIYQNGTMNVKGNGGRILNDGGVRFQNGSNTTIVSSASLEVQSMIRVDNGASFIGAGDLVIADSGLMFAEDDAVVDVDVVNNGNVRVGMPFGGPAQLNLADDYTQSSTGTLFLDLAGTNSSQYDRLNVDDYATIDGTLDVSLTGGFAPSLGDDFLVLDTNDGLSGTFSHASLPSLAAGLMWDMNYSPFALTLSVVECPAGDANCDGEVTGADFLYLQREYGKPAPSPADITGDGVVDDEDIDLWQAQYPASAVAAVQGVPEPASAMLLVIAAAGWFTRGRRSRT